MERVLWFLSFYHIFYMDVVNERFSITVLESGALNKVQEGFSGKCFGCGLAGTKDKPGLSGAR